MPALTQDDMIRRFKSELRDAVMWENELGKEATDLLARSLRTLHKTPDALYLFSHEQRQMQFMREEVRNMRRRMRSFRDGPRREQAHGR